MVIFTILALLLWAFCVYKIFAIEKKAFTVGKVKEVDNG